MLSFAKSKPEAMSSHTPLTRAFASPFGFAIIPIVEISAQHFGGKITDIFAHLKIREYHKFRIVFRRHNGFKKPLNLKVCSAEKSHLLLFASSKARDCSQEQKKRKTNEFI